MIDSKNINTGSSICSNGSSSSSNPGSTIRKRGQHQFLHVADHQIQTGLAIIFLLYLFVTIGSYVQLSSITDMDQQLHHLQPIEEESISSSNKNQEKEELHLFLAQEQEEETPTTTVRSGGKPLSKKVEIEKLQRQFPIHAGAYDKEKILHPAYTTAGKSQARTVFEQTSEYLTVPTFWNPPEYGGNIRQYLGDNGKRLMTREEASSIGSKTKEGLETIYIAIASYRDPECVPTLDSLYQRATHPERIRVAVIDQRLDNDEDPKCLTPEQPCTDDPEQTLCKYKHLIDGMVMDARLGVGPVFARHLGYRFYRGEYFAIQMDSHVRFVEGWDDDIILQWKSANNEMAVLTTYLSDLNNSIDPKTNKAIRPGRPIMCKTDYEGSGAYKHLRHGQQPEGPAMIHGTPTLHPFWAAGFSFSRGHFVIQVPYDQYLPMIFQGEEISLGLRGFTYGYDYYTPERSVCFHMYSLKAYKEQRDKVPHFWENNKYFGVVGTMSMRRLNAIIGMPNEPNAEYDHTDEQNYSLGFIRKKEKFFATYGIHPDTQTVEDNLCSFVGQRMQNMFIPALRDDGMGLDYDKITYQFVDPRKGIEQVKKKLPATPHQEVKKRRII